MPSSVFANNAQGVSVPAPKSLRSSLWLVAGVTAATAVLIVSSASLALRPTPTVVVLPVLFDESEPRAPLQDTRVNTRTVQAPGWLEANPYSVAATALADGVIEEILVLEGDSVEAGQLVARLVRVDAELALAGTEAGVRSKEAELSAAHARLQAAQTDWTEPTERTRAVAVARGSLAGIKAEIDQLPALVAAERARVEQLAEELGRTTEALRSGAATAFEVIVAQKRHEAAQATAIALEQRGPILEAQSSVAHAELVAHERLAELRTPERLALETARADVLRAEAALSHALAARDEAALRLERTEIRAPISGLVMARYKYPGSKVMASMDDPHSNHIVHLYEPSLLQVRVDVPLADASMIHLGQLCEIVVEILPDHTFSGEVIRITNQADLQKNTLQVKVRLIEPSLHLKPEMLTRVRFLSRTTADSSAGSVEPTVLIPQSAITDFNGSDSVYTIRERKNGSGRLARIPVSVVERSNEWVRVRGELRPGDLLAIEHNQVDAGRVRFVLAKEPS